MASLLATMSKKSTATAFAIRLPVRKDTNFPPETPFWCTSTPSQNAKKERTDRLKRLPLLLPLLLLAKVEEDVVKVAR